jgi:hypothetical protein
VLLDRYPPYLPWLLLFVFPFLECFVSGLCDLFAVSFYLNSDSPDKAQQLSPDRGYDFLLLLASCA